MLVQLSVFCTFQLYHLPYLSSLVTSLELRRCFSPEGIGGGEEDGPGEIDFCREDLLDPREGVL